MFARGVGIEEGERVGHCGGVARMWVVNEMTFCCVI